MRIRRMTAPPDLREFDEKIADAAGRRSPRDRCADFEGRFAAGS